MPLSDEEISELVQRLLAKTESSEVRWVKTAQKERYQLSLPNNSIILQNAYDQEAEETYLEIDLCDEDGDVIETIHEGQAANAHVGDQLNRLYELARRQALNVDKQIKAIFQVLRAPSKAK